MQEEDPLMENCSSKKGLAKFQCNTMQAIQIVFLIFVAMILTVIGFDTGITNP